MQNFFRYCLRFFFQSETVFWQIFQNRYFFLIPKNFDTDTDTFFGTNFFLIRYRFFLIPNFSRNRNFFPISKFFLYGIGYTVCDTLLIWYFFIPNFSKLILFYTKFFFETDTDTFLQPIFFQIWYHYFFYTKFFQNLYWYFFDKKVFLKLIPIPSKIFENKMPNFVSDKSDLCLNLYCEGTIALFRFCNFQCQHIPRPLFTLSSSPSASFNCSARKHIHLWSQQPFVVLTCFICFWYSNPQSVCDIQILRKWVRVEVLWRSRPLKLGVFWKPVSKCRKLGYMRWL